MPEPARILMYTQDSFGLGHLRRATNLANALVALRPDIAVLMVMDSPVAPFFKLGRNIDFVKLPTVVKEDAGVFRTGRLPVGYETVRGMRSSMIREMVESFAPDVVLVDHMPGGANRELLPALTSIRNRSLPTRIVLGLRDIIDQPAVTRAVWQHEGVYSAIRDNYDLVLVYGTSEVYPTASEYGLDEIMGDRVRYCGYVCNTGPVDDPDRVREKLGLDKEPIVVVMAGGGADGARLLQTYLEARGLLDREFATVLVTGPFLPQLQRKALRDKARDLGVRVRTTVGDSLSQISAADVVVSMAGYNTMCEVQRFGKPAIVVPRPGPSAEQTMRARLFSERGLIDVIEMHELEPQRMAARLDRALTTPRRVGCRAVPLDGVSRAAAMLLAEVEGPAAAGTARTQPGAGAASQPGFA